MLFNSPLYTMFAGSVIRHILTALSAYLVAKNFLAPDHASDFVTNVTVYLSDALPVILAMGWSMVQKYEHHELTK